MVVVDNVGGVRECIKLKQFMKMSEVVWQLLLAWRVNYKSSVNAYLYLM